MDNLLTIKFKIINDLKIKKLLKKHQIKSKIFVSFRKKFDLYKMETICKILNGMKIDIDVYYRLIHTRFGYSILRNI
jgi:hypothetical protein